MRSLLPGCKHDRAQRRYQICTRAAIREKPFVLELRFCLLMCYKFCSRLHLWSSGWNSARDLARPIASRTALLLDPASSLHYSESVSLLRSAHLTGGWAEEQNHEARGHPAAIVPAIRTCRRPAGAVLQLSKLSASRQMACFSNWNELSFCSILPPHLQIASAQSRDILESQLAHPPAGGHMRWSTQESAPCRRFLGCQNDSQICGHLALCGLPVQL